MRPTSLLLCLCLLLLAALGAGCGHQDPPAPAADGTAAHAEAKGTMAMADKEFFARLQGHSVPHVLFVPELTADAETNRLFAFFNVNLWQWVALAICAVLFLLVLASFRSSGQAPWLIRVFRGFCRWLRDEMIYPVMGKEDGDRFAPYFLHLFFFIAVMNCIGLVPAIESLHFAPATATGTPYVTGALAVVTLVTMLFFGMREQGVVGFWKNLIPHGLPLPLLPLMIVVELVGLLVKPFALTVRLFANMLAGHLVIASAIGLVFVFTKMLEGGVLSFATAVPATGLAVFIYIIEAFVTLLQAYIFAYLSVIFLHQAMHPAH